MGAGPMCSNVFQRMQMSMSCKSLPFNRPLSGRSLGFLKIFPNVRTGLNAVLMFSRLKIRQTRSDTPFTYGMDVYAFGFSWVLGCVFVLLDSPADLMKLSG